MASRRRSTVATTGTRALLGASSTAVAHLTVRLQGPGDSPIHHDVRLRLDYLTGPLEARTQRTLSELLKTPHGHALDEFDRERLAEQLRDWLAKNFTELQTGSTLTSAPPDAAGAVVFVYQRSRAAAPPIVVPPPRPQPVVEQQPAETSQPLPKRAFRRNRM